MIYIKEQKNRINNINNTKLLDLIKKFPDFSILVDRIIHRTILSLLAGLINKPIFADWISYILW